MKSFTYASGALDRAGNRRRDPHWIEQMWHHPECRILPMWQELNLFKRNQNGETAPRLASVDRTFLPDEVGCHSAIFLGLLEDRPYFAVEVPSQANIGDGTSFAFAGLRQLASLMMPQEAALLALARAMIHWTRSHRYCGTCGTAKQMQQGGFLLLCSNQDCGSQTFPRTDPAVIMLVEDRPEEGPARCLLGRGLGWPEGRFSTLAGFVEPGETLEAAVAREVLEETGIKVGQVSYLASQPWPFPASLMLGFRALACNSDLHIDKEELAEARWFTAGELNAHLDHYPLGTNGSISSYLMQLWLEEQKSVHS